MNQGSTVNPFLGQGRVKMNPGSTIGIILTKYSIYNKYQNIKLTYSATP
jgi:hypothetical protein